MIQTLTPLIEWMASAIVSDVGKIALGAASALAIAWVNSRLGIWRDERAERRKRQGATAYSVALVESTLRRYVRDCMPVMNDPGESEDDDWKRSVPEPTLVYPDKIDWTLFEPQTMYQALAIPNMEAYSKAAVRWAFDQATPPDRHGFIEERQRRFAQIAIFSARVQADFHCHHPTPFISEQSEIISEISRKLIELEKAEEDQR